MWKNLCLAGDTKFQGDCARRPLARRQSIRRNRRWRYIHDLFRQSNLKVLLQRRQAEALQYLKRVRWRTDCRCGQSLRANNDVVADGNAQGVNLGPRVGPDSGRSYRTLKTQRCVEYQINSLGVAIGNN